MTQTLDGSPPRAPAPPAPRRSLRGGARRPVSTMARQDARAAYVLIAPALIGFTIFVAIPLVSVFSMSMHDYSTLTGSQVFIGLENYFQLFQNPVFYIVLRNTAVFAIASVPLGIVLGLGAALLVNQKLPAIGIFRTALFIPAVVSLVAWTLVWNLFLQDNGAINQWLGLLGIDGPNWLASSSWSMFSVIMVQALKGVGVNMVLFLAALQNVPGEIREAARIDGAGPWRSLISIVCPFISPTIVMVGILSTIGSLKTFILIYSLTEGGPGYSTSVLGYYIYDQAFGALQMGFASAVSIILFLIALTLTAIQWWGRKKWVHFEN